MTVSFWECTHGLLIMTVVGGTTQDKGENRP
jgi:hypothetical protein